MQLCFWHITISISRKSFYTSGAQLGTFMVVQKQKSCPGWMAGWPGTQGGFMEAHPSVSSSQKELSFRLRDNKVPLVVRAG